MDLRNRLREETKESHQLLDSEVGTLGVFTSSDGHAVYLSCLYQLYGVYGAQIDWASGQAGIPQCVNILQNEICGDCKHAVPGWEPKAAQLESSESMSPSSCWAAAYVLEGSAMGARYMVKQAQSSPLVVSGEIRLGYLSRLAEDSYQRWPAFVAALEVADCDADQTVAAAQEVFNTAANIFANAIRRHRTTSGEI